MKPAMFYSWPLAVTVQTFVEIGSAVRKIFPDKKKQIESLSRVAQLTLGARLIIETSETTPVIVSAV